MSNWTLLLKTNKLHESNIIQGLLAENNVPVQVLNKQESSYNLFGLIEIFVPSAYIELANQLLQQNPFQN